MKVIGWAFVAWCVVGIFVLGVWKLADLITGAG